MLIEPSKQLTEAIQKEKQRLKSIALKKNTYKAGTALMSTAAHEYSGILEARRYDWSVRRVMSELLNETENELMDEALSKSTTSNSLSKEDIQKLLR